MAIVRKLPIMMRERWRKLSNDLIARNGLVGFSNLVDFICQEARVLKTPVFGDIYDVKETKDGKRTFKNKTH